MTIILPIAKDVLIPINPYEDYKEVLKNSPCEIQTDNLDQRGYPRKWLKDRKTSIITYRKVYQDHTGYTLKENEVIFHLCGNRRCINPHHLILIKRDGC